MMTLTVRLVLITIRTPFRAVLIPITSQTIRNTTIRLPTNPAADVLPRRFAERALAYRRQDQLAPLGVRGA